MISLAPLCRKGARLRMSFPPPIALRSRRMMRAMPMDCGRAAARRSLRLCRARCLRRVFRACAAKAARPRSCPFRWSRSFPEARRLRTRRARLRPCSRYAFLGVRASFCARNSARKRVSKGRRCRSRGWGIVRRGFGRRCFVRDERSCRRFPRLPFRGFRFAISGILLACRLSG